MEPARDPGQAPESKIESSTQVLASIIEKTYVAYYEFDKQSIIQIAHSFDVTLLSKIKFETLSPKQIFYIAILLFARGTRAAKQQAHTLLKKAVTSWFLSIKNMDETTFSQVAFKQHSIVLYFLSSKESNSPHFIKCCLLYLSTVDKKLLIGYNRVLFYLRSHNPLYALYYCNELIKYSNSCETQKLLNCEVMPFYLLALSYLAIGNRDLALIELSKIFRKVNRNGLDYNAVFLLNLIEPVFAMPAILKKNIESGDAALLSSIIVGDELVADIKLKAESTQLGKGTYAAVHSQLTSEGHVCAVKYFRNHSEDVLKDSIGCAVEMVETRNLNRGIREATVLMSIKSRFIVSCYGIAVHDGRVAMVMERYRQNLFSFICDNSFSEYSAKKQLEYLFRIAYCLACALEYLYENNLLHRDIKLENILVDNEEQTGFVLADFGVAISVSSECMNHGYLTDEFCTSHGYRAPEVEEVLDEGDDDIFHVPTKEKRQATYSHASDIYSLGIVLRNVLCKCNQLSSQVKSRISKVIDACLKRDPHLRVNATRLVDMILLENGDVGCRFELGYQYYRHSVFHAYVQSPEQKPSPESNVSIPSIGSP